VIKRWQPALPQAMQRHGGRTRPAGPPSAKAEAPPRDPPPDDRCSDVNVGNPTDRDATKSEQ